VAVIHNRKIRNIFDRQTWRKFTKAAGASVQSWSPRIPTELDTLYVALSLSNGYIIATSPMLGNRSKVW